MSYFTVQKTKLALVKWIDEIFRMNVSGFGPLNWVAGKSVTNVIQETVLQVRTLKAHPFFIFLFS